MPTQQTNAIQGDTPFENAVFIETDPAAAELLTYAQHKRLTNIALVALAFFDAVPGPFQSIVVRKPGPGGAVLRMELLRGIGYHKVLLSREF